MMLSADYVAGFFDGEGAWSARRVPAQADEERDVMTDFEFRAWPKTARLNRRVIITEKIDGTNAAVIVSEDGSVGAQSRKRLIRVGDDNYGFARWVADNGPELAARLGPGYHYGEWWGNGIQRGYGLRKDDKRFSLFNVSRWGQQEEPVTPIPGLNVVPVLYDGPFDSAVVKDMLLELALNGSHASPGFMNPEGIIVFHTAANGCFKVTIRDDEVPKALVVHM